MENIPLYPFNKRPNMLDGIIQMQGGSLKLPPLDLKIMVTMLPLHEQKSPSTRLDCHTLIVVSDGLRSFNGSITILFHCQSQLLKAKRQHMTLSIWSLGILSKCMTRRYTKLLNFAWILIKLKWHINWQWQAKTRSANHKARFLSMKSSSLAFSIAVKEFAASCLANCKIPCGVFQ